MNLIIVGASTRAAAFSAQRAGMSPWCADLFADADLARAFPVRRIPARDFPSGLIDAIREAPHGPVLYVGGLENAPHVLQRIERPLWGNTPEVLLGVRSPFLLAEALRRRGLASLDVRATAPPRHDRRHWLLKPRRGGGGRGVQFYRGQPFAAKAAYLQEYCPGECVGITFLGIAEDRACCIGICRMLDGGPFHAPGFHYRGSVGPLDHVGADVQRLGDVLVQDFGLRGLFGVDAVVRIDHGTGERSLLPLEVNPRYTASVEVLERACGSSFLTLHRAVFEHGIISPPQSSGTSLSFGKAIVYARQDMVFPAHGPWVESLRGTSATGHVEYADIPHAGQSIARGGPVLSAFASGPTLEACCAGLEEKAHALDRFLYG